MNKHDLIEQLCNVLSAIDDPNFTPVDIVDAAASLDATIQELKRTDIDLVNNAPKNLQIVLESDYADALAVQTACNLSGIVFSFARIMQRICNEDAKNNNGTAWKNSHPICVLFASKIADLTGCEGLQVFTTAQDVCMTLGNCDSDGMPNHA